MKEYFNKMWNQFKNEGISLYLMILAVSGTIPIVYILAEWLPSWLSPEQCNEIPSLVTPFFYWIIEVTGFVFIIYFVYALAELLITLVKHRSKLPLNYNSMSWKEKEEYDNQIIKKKEEKILMILVCSAFAFFALYTLIYEALSNYYCWE